MFLGYNTNGFAHHRLEDAVEIMAELGYRGVALTPDVHDFGSDHSTGGHTLYPLNEGVWRTTKFHLRESKLRTAIETGARFLLDSRQKHQPTLISPQPDQRRHRADILRRSIDLAAELGSDCVSFWSGTPATRAGADILMARLVEECKPLADDAASQNVRLAFEPEPGMFIDTMDKFAELHGRVNHPAFGLTIDIGHLVCNGELPVSRFLRDWKHVLWNVHIEDMRRGVHDHLMFGEGEVDFADVFAGLREANYQGGVYVELSRHSYDAVNTARKAKAFLDRYLGEPCQ
jgi:sugar phosphate isomerase/epimerase